MAKMWASTHNETVKAKMSAVVTALFDCQEKMGSGYLSAFPSEQFDRFEAVQYVWAPYYTIHKVHKFNTQYILFVLLRSRSDIPCLTDNGRPLGPVHLC